MKIYSVRQEGITAYFMTKREAQRFNRNHDEPEEICEWSKVEIVQQLNEYAEYANANGDGDL